jgi:hypothetical protein
VRVRVRAAVSFGAVSWDLTHGSLVWGREGVRVSYTKVVSVRVSHTKVVSVRVSHTKVVSVRVSHTKVVSVRVSHTKVVGLLESVRVRVRVLGLG